MSLSHPTTFLGSCLGFGAVFSFPPCQLSIPGPLAVLPLPGSTRCIDPVGREPLSQQAKEVSFSHMKEPRKAQEPTWELCSSELVRTQIQTQSCLRRQKGSLINSQRQRHLSNHLLGWNRVSYVQGVGWKYCAVWDCVKVWAWDAAQQRSECRVPVCRSVVNSYGPGWTLTRPPVWDLYRLTTAKRFLNPHEGSGLTSPSWGATN
jgi:hypothetical protein